MNYRRGLAPYPPIQPEVAARTHGSAEPDADPGGAAARALEHGGPPGHGTFTDANQLTDTLFYLLHPELRGRRIGPSQPDLAREWSRDP